MDLLGLKKRVLSLRSKIDRLEDQIREYKKSPNNRCSTTNTCIDYYHVFSRRDDGTVVLNCRMCDQDMPEYGCDYSDDLTVCVLRHN